MKVGFEIDFSNVDQDSIDPDQKKAFPENLELWIMEYFDLPGLKLNNLTVEASNG